MAARAQARQRTRGHCQTPSRTRAGRPRASPAARRGASRINWDRVGRIALTLVLAAVLYSYLNPAIDFVKTYTATTAAKAKLHEAAARKHPPAQAHPDADDPIAIDRRGARPGHGRRRRDADRRPRPRLG